MDNLTAWLTDWLAERPWTTVITLLLGSSVVSTLVTHAVSRISAVARTRQDGYAAASRVLIRRAQYPYRIRRRVSNEPDTVAGLVDLGHALQEDLAAVRTWVKSESSWVGSRFEDALNAIDARVGDSNSLAWEAQPISDPAGMRLGAWGPGDCSDIVADFESAVAWRFGWRRLVPGAAKVSKPWSRQ